jgi:hypothetical protein
MCLLSDLPLGPSVAKCSLSCYLHVFKLKEYMALRKRKYLVDPHY